MACHVAVTIVSGLNILNHLIYTTKSILSPIFQLKKPSAVTQVATVA